MKVMDLKELQQTNKGAYVYEKEAKHLKQRLQNYGSGPKQKPKQGAMAQTMQSKNLNHQNTKELNSYLDRID